MKARSAPGSGLESQTCQPMSMSLRFQPWFFHSVLACPIAFLASLAAQAEIVTIALTGDPVPNGAGEFFNFGHPTMNNAGQVAFTASFYDEDESELPGLWLGSAGSGPLAQIARWGQPAAGGDGTYYSFSLAPGFDDPPALNNHGQFAFQARLTDTSSGSLNDRAIFLGSGGPLAPLVRGGQALHDGNGNFHRFDGFTMNSAGQVVFSAALEPANGDPAVDTGLYIVSSAGVPQKIVREGDPAPDGDGTFSILGPGALSDNGKVAFYSQVINPANNDVILCLGSGTGPPVILAREGQGAPEGNGLFVAFGQPSINSTGDVAFVASLNFTEQFSNDDSGVYFIAASGGGPQAVVRESQPAPNGSGIYSYFTHLVLNNAGRICVHAGILDGPNSGDALVLLGGGLPDVLVGRREISAPGGGSFAGFGEPAFNNGGQVAFRASLIGGGAGLFIGNGTETIEIVREGGSLAGQIVNGVHLFSNIGANGDHRCALNDDGQVAFFANLTNAKRGIFVFTPVLNFIGSAAGTFDAPGAWTLGLLPAAVHDLVFDPATDVVLPGPGANRSVKSLQVGGGAGNATLQLQSGVTLTATNGLTLTANGVLAGDGTIAGNLVSGGLISPGNSTGVLNVTGNMTQSTTGRLLIEIGGPTSGACDKVIVEQSLALAGGTLDVVFIDNFTPQGNETFEIIGAGSINGTFSTINLPALGGGLSWDTANLYSTGTVRVAGAGSSAIQAWRQLHFGSPQNSGPSADGADPDGDGAVNLLEFATRTDPMVPTRLPFDQALADGSFSCTYTRNKAALGEVDFNVEWSESLASGNWNTTGIAESVLSDDGTVQQIKATLAFTGVRQFIRLRVSAQ